LNHRNYSHLSQPTAIEQVAVIGAGGSGLSVSYHLTRLGIQHTVLERGQPGNTWSTERWDSFHLVNPNWALRLHGFEYEGSDPDGYLSKAETVKMLADYAASFSAPVQTGIEITSIERACPTGFILRSESGDMLTENVVIATGAFGVPACPAGASAITGVTQLHSSEYKNAGSLPDGAVLVIGSGQSGAQIMEDLFDAGRQVYLSVSSAGRRPRRYRGRDSSWWNNTMGGFDRTVNDVPSLNVRFGSSAHTSGTKGGHNIYLRAFARDGVRLLGRFNGGSGNRMKFKADLHDSLANTDEHAARWRAGVDRYIEEHGLDAPPEPEPDPPGISDIRVPDPPLELDIKQAGISTVIWATGFRYDYSWIKLPVTGNHGYPVQRRGVTAWPGLYFSGLQWMFSAKSAQFIGVSEDACYVAEHIASKLSGSGT
jgi:putative flavoprotein involved in K+ transport